MDQHPIPQDVTGFQFKLVGAMTVKQFGYVASGVILAVILYYLPLKTPLSLLLKFFLIPFFGIGGVVVAFLPIDGRPIDVMTSNFIKALFSPNQYIYRNQGRVFSFSQIPDAKISRNAQQTKEATTATTQKLQTSTQSANKEEQLRMLLQNTKTQTTSAIDKKEAAFLNTLSLPSVNIPTILQTPPITNPVNSSLPQSLQATSTPQNAPTIQKSTPAIQVPIKTVPQPTINNQPIMNPVQQPAKQSLTQSMQPQPIVPTPAQDPRHVRTIPQDVTKKAGLPHISDTPNVIVGIVKDPRGNVLSNILVEVKDKSGNPVRAFKTNALGQFASATPLSVGTYTMELEDPKKMHRFDIIQITANNQIMLPIEVISHDAREQLRQELFAT